MYPAPGLLERARRAGIQIIVSSDAHRVADLASSFAEATALARRAGYESSLRLSDRRLVALP
jgi:histidinol-phosphatase (PHP family)